VVEPGYLAVALPELDVMTVNKPISPFAWPRNRPRNRVEPRFGNAIRTDDVNAILRRVAAPRDQAGAQNSQSPNTAEGWAVIPAIWWVPTAMRVRKPHDGNLVSPAEIGAPTERTFLVGACAAATRRPAIPLLLLPSGGAVGPR
jgi:hypothetical protein